jgi:hypothetical protein
MAILKWSFRRKDSDVPRELTLTASQFKAQCLDLMAAGAARRLDRVNITKRGKAYVTLNFEGEPAGAGSIDPFGCMKGMSGFSDIDIAKLDAELAAIGEEQAALIEASLRDFA